jgi:argininosuccinate lyase
MAAAASDEMLAATDVADLLVRFDVPFREAHGVVAALVRAALGADKALSELSDDELAEHSDVLAANAGQFREVLQQGSWLESKVSEGGTSSARLAEQITAARVVLDESAPS